MLLLKFFQIKIKEDNTTRPQFLIIYHKIRKRIILNHIHLILMLIIIVVVFILILIIVILVIIMMLAQKKVIKIMHMLNQIGLLQQQMIYLVNQKAVFR